MDTIKLNTRCQTNNLKERGNKKFIYLKNKKKPKTYFKKISSQAVQKSASKHLIR